MLAPVLLDLKPLLHWMAMTRCEMHTTADAAGRPGADLEASNQGLRAELCSRDADLVLPVPKHSLGYQGEPLDQRCRAWAATNLRAVPDCQLLHQVSTLSLDVAVLTGHVLWQAALLFRLCWRSCWDSCPPV